MMGAARKKRFKIQPEETFQNSEKQEACARVRDLQEVIDRIDVLIATLPPRSMVWNPDAWRAYGKASWEIFKQVLDEFGGRRWPSPGGHTHYVKIRGVSSSSTMGSAQALRNWQAAARRVISKLQESDHG